MHRKLLADVSFLIKLARGVIDSPYLLSILQIHIPRMSFRLNNLFDVPVNNVQHLDSAIEKICNKFNIILLESGLDIDIFFDTIIAQFIKSIMDYINVIFYK